MNIPENVLRWARGDYATIDGALHAAKFILELAWQSERDREEQVSDDAWCKNTPKE